MLETRNTKVRGLVDAAVEAWTVGDEQALDAVWDAGTSRAMTTAMRRSASPWTNGSFPAGSTRPSGLRYEGAGIPRHRLSSRPAATSGDRSDPAAPHRTKGPGVPGAAPERPHGPYGRRPDPGNDDGVEPDTAPPAAPDGRGFGDH
ncbi:hypothetical protein ABT112_33320 [Streptomyces sp. NPDC002055]|uniref:hypothetical protein n=1 Tax=Streptomyces sp. NPDC002055 TaxID=3154534 RepID=UPI00332C7B64